MAERVIMPKAGMAMEEGGIVKWHVQEGDIVQKGDVLLEIETDKVVMELEAETSGTLLKILHHEGQTVPVITTIAWIGEEGEEIPEEEAPVSVSAEAAAPAGKMAQDAPSTITSSGDGRIAATPAARRLAAEKNISLARIVPTGRMGEVRKSDVESFKQVKATPLARKIASARGIDLTGISGSGFAGKIKRADLSLRETPVARRQQIKGMRKIIAERMMQTHMQVPAATLVARVDVTDLAELRDTRKANGEVSLSFNDFVMKAVANALAEFAIFNSSIEGDEIVYWKQINVGVAVALDDGLIVPVIKDIDRLTIQQISSRTRDLAGRARQNALTPDEITDGTFTVTNLGMYGIDTFTPIINLPEVAILGVGQIYDKPSIENGQLVNRKVMPLCLTHDHRVIDGALGALFLQRIADDLDNPVALIPGD